MTEVDLEKVGPVRVVCIIGPTAVGKTNFSLKLAQHIKDIEIVSVDSRQIYRYMDIGTDKPLLSKRRQVLHHLVDILDPDEPYSAADFAEDALRCVKRILKRGKKPVFVGGSMFYYNALFEAPLFECDFKDYDLRARLEKIAQEKGRTFLYQRLLEVDPEAASKIHPNDLRRIVRALEVYELSGMPITVLWKSQKKKNSPLLPFYVYITKKRDLLYEGIAARVRRQFSEGFIEEVKWLLENGFDLRFNSMQVFGYKQLVLYHYRRLSLEEALNSTIKDTKAFARRQITWFKKFDVKIKIDLTQKSVEEAVTENIEIIKKVLCEFENKSS